MEDYKSTLGHEPKHTGMREDKPNLGNKDKHTEMDE